MTLCIRESLCRFSLNIRNPSDHFWAVFNVFRLMPSSHRKHRKENFHVTFITCSSAGSIPPQNLVFFFIKSPVDIVLPPTSFLNSRRTARNRSKLRAICAISRAFLPRDKVAVFQFGRKITVTRCFLYLKLSTVSRPHKREDLAVTTTRASVTS